MSNLHQTPRLGNWLTWLLHKVVDLDVCMFAHPQSRPADHSLCAKKSSGGQWQWQCRSFRDRPDPRFRDRPDLHLRGRPDLRFQDRPDPRFRDRPDLRFRDRFGSGRPPELFLAQSL